MNRNLVSSAVVRKWLVNEDENVKPYVRAWKGENPYDTISRMKFNLWAMIVVIVATMVWSVFGPEQAKILGYICAISFFSLGQAGWRSARKELNQFIDTVVWCEFESIPEHVLLRSIWTREDIHEVLNGFVRLIRADILPLEQEYKENHLFPKKSAEVRKLHDSRKARLMKELVTIAPMFSHFQGVDNPLEEAFRLAQLK